MTQPSAAPAQSDLAASGDVPLSDIARQDLERELQSLIRPLKDEFSNLALVMLLPKAKAIYESLHPEARHGGLRSTLKQVPESGTCPSFVQFMATASGHSTSKIYDCLKQTKQLRTLHPEAEAACLGTALSNKLGVLARIAAIPDPAIQLDLVQRFERHRRQVLRDLKRYEEYWGLRPSPREKAAEVAPPLSEKQLPSEPSPAPTEPERPAELHHGDESGPVAPPLSEKQLPSEPSPASTEPEHPAELHHGDESGPDGPSTASARAAEHDLWPEDEAAAERLATEPPEELTQATTITPEDQPATPEDMVMLIGEWMRQFRHIISRGGSNVAPTFWLEVLSELASGKEVAASQIFTRFCIQRHVFNLAGALDSGFPAYRGLKNMALGLEAVSPDVLAAARVEAALRLDAAQKLSAVVADAQSNGASRGETPQGKGKGKGQQDIVDAGMVPTREFVKMLGITDKTAKQLLDVSGHPARKISGMWHWPREQAETWYWHTEIGQARERKELARISDVSDIMYWCDYAGPEAKLEPGDLEEFFLLNTGIPSLEAGPGLLASYEKEPISPKTREALSELAERVQKYTPIVAAYRARAAETERPRPVARPRSSSSGRSFTAPRSSKPAPV